LCLRGIVSLFTINLSTVRGLSIRMLQWATVARTQQSTFYMCSTNSKLDHSCPYDKNYISTWNEKYWNVLFSTHLFVKTFYQVSDIPPQILIEAVTLGQVRNPRFKRLDFWLAADQIVHYLVKVGFVSSMNLL
jgi:hypothetical protein